MMNKLFAIYACSLVILISIVLPLAFPVSLIVIYAEQGFSGLFIFISITTIIIEPLTIVISYAFLKNIKYIYNDLLM